MINPRVFREYDIRGVADRDLHDAFVADLGRALGTMFVGRGARRITLGRDCRLSSPRIHDVLKAELLDAGLQVVDVGVVHTPALYFSVFHLNADGGVMITASLHPILPDYIATIADNIRLGARRPKVIVDGGNGTGGVALLPILEKLGIEAEGIFCEPDGRFPNHHPDPTVPENLEALRARVHASGAEVGIALDGGADRVGAVDGRGRIVWGDQLMMLFAREILKETPGATFVSEVKCSQALFDEITARGGRAIMWKVGHSLIKVKMKEEKAALAGEMSGHMFFADRWYGFDDAVYAGARLVELLSRSPATLAEHYDTLPVLHNTPEIRLDCPEEIKFEVVRRTVEWFRERYPIIDVDGVRVSFQEDGRNVGWGLVRASNTGAVLVLRFEADTAARLASIRALVEDRLHQIIAEITA